MNPSEDDLRTAREIFESEPFQRICFQETVWKKNAIYRIAAALAGEREKVAQWHEHHASLQRQSEELYVNIREWEHAATARRHAGWHELCAESIRDLNTGSKP